jgi:hypothetical protein
MRVLLSVTPVVPMGVYGMFLTRAIHRLDELETRIHLEGASGRGGGAEPDQ